VAVIVRTGIQTYDRHTNVQHCRVTQYFWPIAKLKHTANVNSTTY